MFVIVHDNITHVGMSENWPIKDVLMKHIIEWSNISCVVMSANKYCFVYYFYCSKLTGKYVYNTYRIIYGIGYDWSQDLNHRREF